MDETGRLIEAGAHPMPPHGATDGSGRQETEQEVRSAARPADRARGAAGAAREKVRPRSRGLPADPLRRMRTREIVTELARKGSLLARKEIELAKVELKSDVRAEIRTAGGLGVAGLCAVFTVQLLLVAVVLALMEGGVLPGWTAALVVAAVVLAIGVGVGLWGWGRRVKKPLGTTRHSLREDVRWAKEQIA